MQAHGTGPGVAIGTHRLTMLTLLKEWCATALVQGLCVRADARWTPVRIAWMAVLFYWQDGSSLGRRFETARAQLTACLGHVRGLGRTYAGWVQAWVKWSPRLLALLGRHLQGLIRAMATAGGCWQTDGWVLWGCDGTRVDLPRTAAHERAYGCAGRQKTTPQMWLTMILHLGTGLPWCSKIGKAHASERTHLRALLSQLPPGGLLVADAGFTGYDLWQAMMEQGQAFLIRVGANVRLLTDLGCVVRRRDGQVYLWPRQQRRAGQKPLVLRLIQLSVEAAPMYLITNVYDPQRLSDAQAARFYRRRWLLELWYRAMKQTLEQRKLRSHSPVHAALELRWAVVSLTCLGLLQVRALVEQGQDPVSGSVSGTLKVVRTLLEHPRRRGGPKALHRRLVLAVRDRYVRRGSKAARDWPRPKTQRPPGPPQLRPATATEVQAAQQLPAFADTV